MEKMEKLGLKVCKAYLDRLDQWVTKVLLENLARMEYQEPLETQVQGEILEKMDHLV